MAEKDLLERLQLQNERIQEWYMGAEFRIE